MKELTQAEREALFEKHFSHDHPDGAAIAALMTDVQAAVLAPGAEMLEVGPGVFLPRWVLAQAGRIAHYMEMNAGGGQWSVGEIQKRNDDTALLDWLWSEACDLRCVAEPTGGDDSDVRWVVVAHSMAKPYEREVARSTTDDPRDAIRQAKEKQS